MASVHNSPSIRSRYFKRARALKEHKPFLDALDRALDDWNQQHPDYVVRRTGSPPKQPVRDGLGNVHVPGQIEKDSEYWRRDREERTRDEHALRRAAFASRAHSEWNQLVNALCEEWWPALDFPVWSGAYRHPAGPFVAGCLLWNPRIVPEEWIVARPVAAMLSTGAPFDTDPEAAKWRARYEWVMRELAKVDPTLARQLHEESDWPAAVAWLEQHWANEKANHQIVIPHPGMSTTDWRQLPAMDNPLPARVRELKAAGMSQRKIAFTLGIDRSTVKAHLDPTTSPPAHS